MSKKLAHFTSRICGQLFYRGTFVTTNSPRSRCRFFSTKLRGRFFARATPLDARRKLHEQTSYVAGTRIHVHVGIRVYATRTGRHPWGTVEIVRPNSFLRRPRKRGWNRTPPRFVCAVHSRAYTPHAIANCGDWNYATDILSALLYAAGKLARSLVSRIDANIAGDNS